MQKPTLAICVLPLVLCASACEAATPGEAAGNATQQGSTAGSGAENAGDRSASAPRVSEGEARAFLQSVYARYSPANSRSAGGDMTWREQPQLVYDPELSRAIKAANRKSEIAWNRVEEVDTPGNAEAYARAFGEAEEVTLFPDPLHGCSDTAPFDATIESMERDGDGFEANVRFATSCGSPGRMTLRLVPTPDGVRVGDILNQGNSFREGVFRIAGAAPQARPAAELSDDTYSSCLQQATSTAAMVGCGNAELARLEPILTRAHASADRTGQSAARQSVDQLKSSIGEECRRKIESSYQDGGGSLAGVEFSQCVVAKARESIISHGGKVG